MTPPIPHDAALPQMSRLLDAEAMASVLERLLGRQPITGVRVRDLRYKPRQRLVVRYTVESEGAADDAVAMADSKADLAARAAAPKHLALVEKLSGRSPARTPLAYDPELDALVQWPPLDVGLPVLAEAPAGLCARLEAAGVELDGPDDLPRLVKYWPLKRATLRLERHFVKTYAGEAAFARSVDGLAAAARLPVQTARCEAVLPDLRVAVQSLVPGRRPAGPAEVAPQAGALLARMHEADLDGARVELPADRLARARRDARVLGTVAPGLRPRLDQLVRQLELSTPEDDTLVTSHGGFHLSQLLESDGGLAVIDFDGVCRAPRARDLGSYLGSLVETRANLTDVEATYDTLSATYGRRPPGVAWYLTTLLVRRARRPFMHFVDGWPEQVEARLAAAEAALHLEL
jgi:phosphotransferase family enzyme